MSVIQLDNISRKFGTKEVLQKLSLSVNDGEIFGLIGLNGAGKTTLIRTILGLIGRDKGNVSLFGKDPFGQDVSVLSRIGVVLEHNGFYGNLTVSENLKFYAKAKNLSKEEYNKFYDEFVVDSDVGKKDCQVKYFSRGEKMQCALFRAFMGWPELLIFDEPTLGLDIDAYTQFITMCKIASQKGSALFISSHHLEAIDQLCDRIGLLENGKISILDDEKKHHTWSIRILNLNDHDEDKVIEIIKGLCQCKVSRTENQFNFRVKHGVSDDVIPKIVRSLTELDYAITEVRPEIRDLKYSIKKFGVEES